MTFDTEPSPAVGELRHPSPYEPGKLKVTSGILAHRRTYSIFYVSHLQYITWGYAVS